MYYYIKNKFIKSEEASIPFSDAGFLYGDGLFETMRFDNQEIFSPIKHLSRLQKGLELIHLEIEQSKADLLNLLNSVIKKNNLSSGIIRMMITRGISDKSMSRYNIPNIYISIKPFYEIPRDPVKVVYLDETKYPIIRFTPAIKSMNYIGNMLAKNDADKLGAFEPVFFNKYKIITECAIRNIFYIKNNILITPALDLGILSGVMRDTIIDIANALDMDIKEAHTNLSDINNMQEAFISSTGIGLLACFWDDWHSEYLQTNKIKKELFNRIKIS